MTGETTLRKQEAEKYRTSMPGQVGDVFADLWQDLVVLQGTWEIFIDLFAAERETVALLNDVSPFFFRIVQEALLHELHMSLARLTDPPFSGPSRKQQNVSLPRLLYEIESSDAPFAKQVRSAIDALVLRCAPVRTIRHKVIAHNDLHVALQLTSPLPGLAKDEFGSLISDVIALMNRVEIHYRDSATMYTRGVAAYAVHHLLEHLRRGRAACGADHQ